MFGFSNPDQRSAIVVDVGSSSVGVAIVCIQPDGVVDTIWEHREYSLIHDDSTNSTQVRQIKTSLTNAFLELTNSGLKVLRESDYNVKIYEVQAIVSAPWSYTITKTITLKDEHPFTVTQELIDELVESAKKQSKLVFATDKVAKSLGLELTHGDVLGVALNGYQVIDPIDQEGRTVALSYIETAISEDITETLSDVVSKFFPTAKHTEYSFMYAFYLTMKNLHPNTSEICLIDVTGEATEVGVVREDILQNTTHIQSGMYTIARDIAQACGVTKQEAYGYLKDDWETLESRLTEKNKEKISTAVESYIEKVSNMFLRTGDKLSIPETIFLHTDARTQDFFVRTLEAAAKKATGKRHTVHPISGKLLGVKTMEDTAILLSVNFLSQKENYMKLLPKDN